MFRIGEFSKIARVSGRMLRHYDKIDLFKPVHIDPVNGYRYYSADQLPNLNRILALKDLGLTLDQITRLMNENISVDEIQGMLTLRKSEIEQSLQDEVRRINTIEARLEQIAQHGSFSEHDIVIKNIPAQRMLAHRGVVANTQLGFGIMGEIVNLLPSSTAKNVISTFAILFHSDMFEPEDIDIEIGYYLSGRYDGEISLSNGWELTERMIPAVDRMATYVTQGSLDYSYSSYQTMGTWMEANGYHFAGPAREVILEMRSFEQPESWVREVQIPIEDNTNILGEEK